MSSSEEKLDDFLQQVTDSEAKETSSASRPFSRGSSAKSDEQAYCVLLREIAAFLTEQQEGVDIQELPSKKKKIEISAEADRLLRDSASVFSDTRPPPDFVVYQDGSLSTNRGEEDDSASNGAAGTPIFDGSVANATPPPLGGSGASAGAGTILHLACALDVPLALAFLLAMGADARASHTAFRRLMIHEAACNGSINCLTLLLELGRKCGDKEAVNDAKMPIGGRSSSTLEFDLPFLPRRIDRADAIAPLQMYVKQNSFLRRLNQPNRVEMGKDFISVLRLFHEYASKVEAGTISELDAARQVLDNAALSDLAQNSLARSCGFLSQPPAMIPAPRNILRAHGGSSDGHGNTPLHWAAFKNETECVSLLLKYNADPNARAHPSGWTPLHDAAYSNSTETIALLLDAGAQVDARANSGATPLCFAAQEDAASAAGLLLKRGADLTTRCAGGPVRDDGSVQPGGPHSRFSGYTPLHYCAHYNAHKAARALLSHPTSKKAMEIPDLSERLPIHVAAARGSSDVLRELLHAGARVETRVSAVEEMGSRRFSSVRQQPGIMGSVPSTPIRRLPPSPERVTPRSRSSSVGRGSSPSTPVSSPLLRSMIPSQPVTSTKPWNCLTQRSIDECRQLISEAEQSWSPDRHSLFTPADRMAVVELLRVGKRLETQGTIFIDLWPQVLTFCGRGWFEVEEDEATCMDMSDSVEFGFTDISPTVEPSENDDSLALPTF